MKTIELVIALDRDRIETDITTEIINAMRQSQEPGYIARKVVDYIQNYLMEATVCS